MEIQIAVAKIDRHSARESGDTVEIIERPNGGVSVVLADGKLNNNGSKVISMKVVHRIIGLLSEGIHDGAAARAVSNMLYKENAGKASASLNIMSCDLQSDTIVLTKGNLMPIVVIQDGKVECMESDSICIGTHEDIKPSVYQIPIQEEITIVIFTDGIANAGSPDGMSLDLCMTLDALFQEQDPTANEVAEFLLSQAIGMDQKQPEDDMCVVVLQTVPQSFENTRRLSIRIPVPPNY